MQLTCTVHYIVRTINWHVVRTWERIRTVLPNLVRRRGPESCLSGRDETYSSTISARKVKGSLTRDFHYQIFLVNQCPPGPYHIRTISNFFENSRRYSRMNVCLSAVSTTPAKKDKNFEIKFCFIFCWELSLVHFTPKDWIFANCRWHHRIIYGGVVATGEQFFGGVVDTGE